MEDSYRSLGRWVSPLVLTGAATTLMVRLGIQLGPVYGFGMFALIPVASAGGRCAMRWGRRLWLNW